MKLLYILKLLEEKSDENHPVSTQQIIDYLDQQQIRAERKTVYSDIHTLEEFGYEIAARKGKESGYYLKSRRFETAELKLLVDAVLASKFITAQKTKQLIKKLTDLSSVYDAGQLKRQLYMERIKNENDQVYLNVDEIHRAIRENKKIAFYYYSWGKDKRLHARRNQKRYRISPFYLIWKDEYYYLVAYDSEAALTKYYRVDKMQDMEVLEENREGHEITGQVNPAEIASRDFSMFAGKNQSVTLFFPEEMIGVVIDRFGKDITIRQRDEELFSARVSVSVSQQFFGWISGFGGRIRIEMPLEVKQEYVEYLKTLLAVYDPENPEA